MVNYPARAIDTGMFRVINGVDQWVTIRGSDPSNPILFLLGGAGVALSRMAEFFMPWERNFTLVQWDQPGAGATQAKNGDAGTGPLTLDRIASDGLAVAEFVRERLRRDKIVLLGLSGGSIVGLKMVKERPDLFSAYVGSGQIVNWSRQEAVSYALILDQARAAGNQKVVAELEQIGPPPYKSVSSDTIKGKYATALTPAEQAFFAALDPAVMGAARRPPANARYIAKDLPLQDLRAGAMAAYEKLRDEIAAFDARQLGLKFDVPMFFFQGERDAYTATSEVQAYVEEIQAPRKRIEVIQGGGHSSFFLRDQFLTLLNKHVRPAVAAPLWPS